MFEVLYHVLKEIKKIIWKETPPLRDIWEVRPYVEVVGAGLVVSEKGYIESIHHGWVECWMPSRPASSFQR